MEIKSIDRHSSLTIHCTGIDTFPGTGGIFSYDWHVVVKDSALHGVFNATADVTIIADAFTQFLDELCQFEHSRSGHITLVGASPAEFNLELFSCDHSGHVALRYQVGCHRLPIGAGDIVVDGTVTLTGAFEIDVEFIPALVHEFTSLHIPGNAS